MTKATFGDASTTAASNTTFDGANIDEGCPPSGINNAIRSVVAAAKGALTAVATSGTNTYTATLAPAPDAYATNFEYLINFATASTSTTPTLNLNSLGAKTIVQRDGSSALTSGDLNGSHVLIYDGTNFRVLNPTITTVARGGTGQATLTAHGVVIGNGTSGVNVTAAGSAGQVLTSNGASADPTWQGLGVAQIVNTETGAVATGTTTTPLDNTIPQNTEGNQFMSLSITPTNSGSTLIIDVVLYGSASGGTAIIVGLYQDSTANALAVGMARAATTTSQACVAFRHKMTAGTTSSTTFNVRAGNNGAGTLTFNGESGAGLFGTTLASSITITEYLP